MTLVSASFFIFVTIALVAYYVVPIRFRWIVLLAASFTFYGIVCLDYLPFLCVTIVTTWLGAMGMEKLDGKRKAILKENKAVWSKEEKKQFKNKFVKYKRIILIGVLVFNFGILGILKYYNWIAGTLGDRIGVSFPMVTLLLPLGISFYTFQTMGYLLDVYWEKTPAQKNPAKFALFASFFPQIIQGPIAIYDELAVQLNEGHRLKYENIKYGFQLILWGLFLKMVLADRSLVALNSLLDRKDDLGGFWNAAAIVIYAFQLYTDFSGGINISRGVAQMFGIQMAENFRRPFFSKDVSEFWRRWHISLGRWLKTYLFYPIAVSKPFLKMGRWLTAHIKGKLGAHLGRVLPGCIGTLITFLVIGMWHGANWRYAGFGLWNGIIIFISMLCDPLFGKFREKIGPVSETLSYRMFQILRTTILVLGGFAFDIADNLRDSVVMLTKCVTNPMPPAGIHAFKDFLLGLGLQRQDWYILAAGLLLLFCVSLYQERSGKSVRVSLDKQCVWFQWIVMLAAMIAIFMFGMYGPGVTAGEFVYMQF